jgi:hypothetical protein
VDIAPRAATPTPHAVGNGNGNGSNGGNGGNGGSAGGNGGGVITGPGNAPSGARRDPGTARAAEPAPDFSLEGLIRDERGIRMAPETED